MTVDHRYQASEPRHPIQVAARRTGLTADVIRAWERRHSAVAPKRSDTARRLYSDEDVERLLLLRRATLLGRRIGEIAHLPTGELRELVERDESATEKAPGAPAETVEGGIASAHLDRCLDALKALDSARMELALNNAARTLSPQMLIEKMLAPLLRRVGDAWEGGSLSIGHEHLASVLVRSLLGSLRAAYRTPRPGPEIVVTTPAGQIHELGALMVSVMASAAGWQVNYLGPNLPAEEIAAFAAARRARVVALSIVYPLDDSRLPDELRRLRALLPSGTKLLVGGPGAAAYERALRAVGASSMVDMLGFAAELESAK